MLGFLTKLGFALVVVLVVVVFSFVVSDELSESFFNFEFTSSFKSSRSYTELSSFIADSAQTGYCTAFPCASVSVLVI